MWWSCQVKMVIHLTGEVNFIGLPDASGACVTVLVSVTRFVA